jgi:hypothetical protein
MFYCYLCVSQVAWREVERHVIMLALTQCYDYYATQTDKFGDNSNRSKPIEG